MKGKGLLGITSASKGVDVGAEDMAPVEGEADDSGEFDAAAEAMFDALKESDLGSFKAALKLALETC